MIYKICNWDSFQHYKDRNPAWVKLHSSLILSEVWIMSNNDSKALIIACMLLAARNEANDGTFNGEPAYVKRFANLDKNPCFNQLIEHGFIVVHDASNVHQSAPKCYQGAPREEKRREEKIDAQSALINLGCSEQLAKDYLSLRKQKKAAVTATVIKHLVKESQKAGVSVSKAIEIQCSRGWQGFNAEWVKAEDKTETADPVVKKIEAMGFGNIEKLADGRYRSGSRFFTKAGEKELVL